MDIGIDLGTAYSVIAVKGKVPLSASYPGGVYLGECDVTIIPTPVGDPTFPSVFWVNPDDPDEVLVGSDAKEKAKEGEAPIMFSKRSIGTQEPLRLGDRTYTAKEVATEILRHLKRCAEQALGEPVRRAVVTLPAYFEECQIQETHEAALAAGFDMALPGQVMWEPAAAALAYTLGDDRDPLQVMTYDLGGGTFDVTVLERREGVITMKGFDGDHLLGGYNFDRALVQWIFDRLRESGREIPYDENDPADRARRARLLQLAEMVKFDLAYARSDKVKVNVKGSDILVDSAGRPVQIILGINRQEYVALIQDEMDKTIRCCHQALAKAGINAEGLDLILLVGGSTYAPWVKRAVEAAFGAEVKCYAPDLIVAAGAAIRVADLCARYDLQQLLDIGQDYLPLAESPSLPAPAAEPARRSPFTRDPKPTEEEIAAAIRLIRFAIETTPRLAGPAGREVSYRDYVAGHRYYVMVADEPKPTTMGVAVAVPPEESGEVIGTEANLGLQAPVACLANSLLGRPSGTGILRLDGVASTSSSMGAKPFSADFFREPGHFQQREPGRRGFAEIKPAVADQIRLKAYVEPGQGPQETYTADVDVPDKLGWFDILPREQGGGSGGFGIVRRAKDRSSHVGREVALKFPRAQNLKEEWRERVQREAALWRSLSERRHPNIVHLEDLCTDPGSGLTFLVMEYVKGGNLADRLRDRATKERVQMVTAVLEDICRGLAFAHENSVVHGDVKPQNILVTEDMRHAKLGDFGHAVEVSSPTSRTDMLGALPFLAPESFAGQKTFATDVYALGATLYYLLTGQYPFAQPPSGPDAANDWERFARKRRAFRPDLSGLAEEIPRWLIDLVQGCMEPDSSRRLADGQAVLDRVLPILRPSDARRIVITISRNMESQTIDFDVDIHGERFPEKLTKDLSNEIVGDLSRAWGALGDLAISRAQAQHGHGNTRAVDAKIRAQINQIGDDYAHFALGGELRERLGQRQTDFLRLIFDAQLAALPWELFRIGNTPLGRLWPMALSPKLHRSIRPPDQVTVTERRLKVLLVSDPTGSLEVAKDEIQQLRDLITHSAISGHCEVTVADENTRVLELRCRIRDCDLLHFAGHGVHAPDDLEKSGLLLKGHHDRPEKGDVLRVTELAQLWSKEAPLLVFANACFSTLVPEPPLRQSRLLTDTAFGLAQAMLSGGVRTYVGSLWSVPDDGSAAKFASLFYRNLFAGRTVGQAMLHARLACVEELGEEDLTWARYALFGEPWSRLPDVDLPYA